MTASLQIDKSWRRQVDRFQDESKTSQPTEGRSRRQIESGNTSWPNQVETTKVKFVKSVFFQVESVQERSNLKVEVKAKLNISRFEAKVRWVD